MKKEYFAEMIGTMVLVLFGCGSAVIAMGTIGNVGVSLAFGIAIIAMAYSIGPISGCHVNPAVTIGVYVSGRSELKDMIGYIIFQVIGAFIGTLLLWALVGTTTSGLGSNLVNPEFTAIQVMLFEAIFTFIFVFVILGVTKTGADNAFAGLAIGFSLIAIHLVGIPIDGTSVNPARSIAPAIVSMLPAALNSIWIFIVFPIIGAILAGLTWRTIFTEK